MRNIHLRRLRHPAFPADMISTKQDYDLPRTPSGRHLTGALIPQDARAPFTRLLFKRLLKRHLNSSGKWRHPLPSLFNLGNKFIAIPSTPMMLLAAINKHVFGFSERANRCFNREGEVLAVALMKALSSGSPDSRNLNGISASDKGPRLAALQKQASSCFGKECRCEDCGCGVRRV